MRQKSIGEVLRIAREARGWNFTDAQRATKVQAKYLQALEYNDFDFIPDPAYLETFLINYAEALDLDAQVLLEAYRTNSLVVYYEEGEDEVLASELQRGYKIRKRKKGSFLPLFYLLLASCVMLILVMYVVYSRIQNRTNQTEQSSSYSVSSQQTATASSTSVSSSSTLESTASSTSSSTAVSITGSGEAVTVKLTGATYPVDITIAVKDVTSWISLSETELAGGVVLSPDNPSVTTTIAEGITSSTLVLGVVKGVEVTLAGQTLDLSALTSDTGTITLNIE